MKYSLLLILGVTAALTFPLPEAKAEAEYSQEIGPKIDSTIKVERKDWDDIVSEQLKRRDEQIAQQALEAARLKAVEDAKKAEQARLAQIPKPVQKVAQKVSSVARIASANSYSWGQCVWYVATRRAVPMWGNANQWLANARAAGWATGNVPRVGAIAWTGQGYAGHVAIVEAVNGNQVTVSDMNYAGVGVVTTRLTSASEWVYIY